MLRMNAQQQGVGLRFCLEQMNETEPKKGFKNNSESRLRYIHIQVIYQTLLSNATYNKYICHKKVKQ